MSSCTVYFRSRKRRPSSSQDQDESREEEMKDEDGGGDDEPKEEEMTECTAALVLMSLSCSPHSPSIQGRYSLDFEYIFFLIFNFFFLHLNLAIISYAPESPSLFFAITAVARVYRGEREKKLIITILLFFFFIVV